MRSGAGVNGAVALDGSLYHSSHRTFCCGCRHRLRLLLQKCDIGPEGAKARLVRHQKRPPCKDRRHWRCLRLWSAWSWTSRHDLGKQAAAVAVRLAIGRSSPLGHSESVRGIVSSVRLELPTFRPGTAVCDARHQKQHSDRSGLSAASYAELPRGLAELDLSLLRCGVGDRGAKVPPCDVSQCCGFGVSEFAGSSRTSRAKLEHKACSLFLAVTLSAAVKVVQDTRREI